MNRTLYILLAAGVLIALYLFLRAKSNNGTHQDEVINVSEDDPEMNAAMAKARESLPQFWQIFDDRKRGESDFALKVQITDKRGSEHFWVVDLERREGKTMGSINNDPNIVRCVKIGDRIEIPEADISDWMYVRDGKMVGNRTIVPLFKQMSPAEAAQYKSMMADE